MNRGRWAAVGEGRERRTGRRWGAYVNEVVVSDAGPQVRLRSATDRPYDDAISAARTCYSPRVIDPEEITDGQRERKVFVFDHISSY